MDDGRGKVLVRMSGPGALRVAVAGTRRRLFASATPARLRLFGVSIFETRRAQGDADLQMVAEAAADPVSVREVHALLDGLGTYEALQDGRAAGRPSGAALAKYRSATDLLRLTLLPGA